VCLAGRHLTGWYGAVGKVDCVLDVASLGLMVTLVGMAVYGVSFEE